jgi:hypothetical protein
MVKCIFVKVFFANGVNEDDEVEVNRLGIQSSSENESRVEDDEVFKHTRSLDTRPSFA